MRTSQTHPVEIAEVHPFAGAGKVGLTFCPGKTQQDGMTGAWARDLGTDLDRIADWNATAVVTLIEDHEIAALQVPDLGKGVRARHMEWHHLPIPDYGVGTASFETSWAAAGEHLRARVRHGFNVLIHCKGGLGRAGSVAGRLLIELGLSGPEAVAAIRKVRPGAIENDRQMQWVMAQRPVAEAMPDTTVDAIRDRAIGSLTGLAVGDAVGATLEFTARDKMPLLTDMIGGGPWKLNPGEWTDDTAMALALAHSLAADPGLDERHLIGEFMAWWDRGVWSCTGDCFDIGVTTRQALQRWKMTGDPFAGSTDPGTAGNGSLMRLSPVAIRHHRNRATLWDVAARQSRTTHAAPEAVDACVGFAEILADAIEGRPLSDVLRDRNGPWAGGIGPVMAGGWRGKSRAEVRGSGYVVPSLEASIWSVARSGSFRSAVLLAANLGDDADTTGAITGQLAGAIHGESSIPHEWRAKLAWGPKISAMARALL